MKEMPKAYNPSSFEQRWYHHWVRSGQFRPQGGGGKGQYTIAIPPPNVTGALTIGHVLNNTIQDVLIRWKRMQGFETLWLPGTDHAGIATQNRVRNHLRDQGIDYKDLGREKFIARVWEWKEQYGGKIIKQLRLLGCSCDWERERFTLDDGLSAAVEEVFKHLFRKGLIYRGEYLVNWCVGCHTALSDEEVEHQEIAGHFWHIRYPSRENPREGIVVATTRPETMLGDTAVAIHPGDKRYQKVKSQGLILPLMGREIPVIEDEYVDPEFGTGALKVTPGHDPNDYQIGQRHDLEVISVIDLNGRMTAAAGRFAGMERMEARKAVVAELKKQGLLVKIEPFNHAVGHCYRCRQIVEPAMSRQWFVKMEPLARPAIQAAQDGELRFVPERWKKTYLHWLENVRDWCISRQLWWGHRIPVWYCQHCGEAVLTGDQDRACPACGAQEWTQDEDVLDTWFSSWLWPFSTLGWPAATEDLKRFYPTDALVTAPDIIFFWVARMIMAGYEFQGQKPFTDIYLHGVVRDEQGRKMSKSLGNSPDPIDMIEEFGADALRFTMLMLTPTGNDILFGKKKVEVGRDFANKLWNAGRFILFNLRDEQIPAAPAGEAPPEDAWIQSRLAQVITEADKLLGEYRFNDVSRLLYDFTWKEFCAWYLEIAKVRIQKGSSEEADRARWMLVEVYKQILALLHPLMPFITEEIYSYLPGKDGELILGPWPAARTDLSSAGAEETLAFFQEAVTAIRNIRSEMNIPPAKQVPVGIKTAGREAEILRSLELPFKVLAKIAHLEIDADYVKPHHSASGVAGASEIHVSLEGVIDLDAERSRLRKDLTKVEKALEGSRKKLANQDFLERAKPEVVDLEREKLEQWEATRAKIDRALAVLED
jgi:valyl-tRNA synthetase